MAHELAHIVDDLLASSIPQSTRLIGKKEASLVVSALLVFGQFHKLLIDGGERAIYSISFGQNLSIRAIDSDIFSLSAKKVLFDIGFVLEWLEGGL